METPRPAVILLSGGLDSATCLAIARDRGFVCHCLTIDYNQRHRVELDAAHAVADALGAASHTLFPLDLRAFGGSALTDDTPVPKDRDEHEMLAEIPSTYVPARNLIFLSIALARAETLGACDIFVGVNAIDYSGYPDCRPEFIRAFEQTANLATRLGVEGATLRVHTPLIDMTKARIIRTGVDLGVDYAQTISCYDPDADGRACARCDACILRARGFAQAGIEDPTRYRTASSPNA